MDTRSNKPTGNSLHAPAEPDARPILQFQSQAWIRQEFAGFLYLIKLLHVMTILRQLLDRQFLLLSPGDIILNFSVAIRSIFSTCNALCQGGLLTLLDVPPSVCYPSGRRWQRRAPKPGEQRNLDLRIGGESASRHDDFQHQGGRGPAVRGKVNPGEVLIKVVIRNKPDRHGFWGRFVKSLQNTAFRRFSVAFHGLGYGRRLC